MKLLTLTIFVLTLIPKSVFGFQDTSNSSFDVYFSYEIGDFFIYQIQNSSGKVIDLEKLTVIDVSFSAKDSVKVKKLYRESLYNDSISDTVTYLVDKNSNILTNHFSDSLILVLNSSKNDLDEFWTGGLLNESDQSYAVLVNKSFVLDFDFNGESDLNGRVIGYVFTHDTTESYQDFGFEVFDFFIIERFGIIEQSFFEGGEKRIQKGGIINGNTYGDTTFAIPTSIFQPTSSPKNIRVTQNYPNPFNPGTTLNFKLDEKSNTSIFIYSINGKKIRNIIENQILVAGHYAYELDFTKKSIPSGNYIVLFKFENQIETQIITYIK